MNVAILRRIPEASASMDVYADNLIKGLNRVRPNWEITSLYPIVPNKKRTFGHLYGGLMKYYQRYVKFPISLQYVKADVFHIIDHSDGYISRFLHRWDKPNVVTCHDIINLTNPDTFENRARYPTISLNMWLFAVKSMRYANKVITVSEHTKKEVVKHLGIDEESIRAIPNAVDNIFRPLDKEAVARYRERIGIEKNTFCLLNVGSNNGRKNIISILEVIRSIKDMGNSVAFLKVGGDFDDKQKEFIRVNQLEDHVRYIGQPKEEELILIYNASDCLLAPSFCEGFGMTILEAMACGTPVITSNVSAMPEVAGDAAVLIDPYDKNDILQAVVGILKDEVKQDLLIKKGLDRVTNYRWENTAEQVAQAYEQMLEHS